MKRLCLILPLMAAAALAQQPAPGGAVSGPLLGYLWNPDARLLRPILGVPGSSLLGSPMDLGATVSLAEVSPSQDYALAVEAESGAVLLVDLSGGAGLKPVAGALAGPDRIVMSPGGGAAALYYRERRAVQLLSGLPQTPAASELVNLAALPGVLAALGVSDRGGLVLAAVSEGDAGSLFLLSAGAEPRQIGRVGRAAAVTFLEDSTDALVADEGRNEVVLIRDVAGAAETRLLAGERDGFSHPVAVGVAGGRMLAADAGSNTVALLDPTGGAPALLPCACNVTGLARLRGSAVFRLTAPGESPQYLVEAGDGPARVLFVPGDPGTEATPDGAPVRLPRARSR
jgi:hypothetical protein